MAIDPTVYAAVKKELLELIRAKRCNPLMIRLAWHDSGTYDKVRYQVAQKNHLPDEKLREPAGARRSDCPLPVQNISSFPERGGANGSVRFKPECDHAANAGEQQLCWRFANSLIGQSPCCISYQQLHPGCAAVKG